MRFVSLFAGIGGFDLGLERTGHECIGQVEIDKNARQVLTNHWPNVIKHDDVTTSQEWAVKNGLVGNVDTVVGGFPCQDLSIAGHGAGLSGRRSGLFYAGVDFAKTVKAKTIILENVPGLLSSDRGRDFGRVLTTLANSGYSNIEWRVFNSQFYGVPQRRRRVFIIASSGTEPFRQVLSESESSSGNTPAGEQTRENTPARTHASVGNDGRLLMLDATRVGDVRVYDDEISQTVISRWGTGGGNVPYVFRESSFGAFTEGVGTLKAVGGCLGGGSENLVVMRNREGKAGGGKGPLLGDNKSFTLATNNDQVLFTKHKVRRLTPLECERLQGFPDHWTAGQSDTQRYKQLGNAVTVNVIQAIGAKL